MYTHVHTLVCTYVFVVFVLSTLNAHTVLIDGVYVRMYSRTYVGSKYPQGNATYYQRYLLSEVLSMVLHEAGIEHLLSRSTYVLTNRV